MIEIRAGRREGAAGATYVLGLTRAELGRLLGGESMLFDLRGADDGSDGSDAVMPDVQVCLYAGDTDADLMDGLRRAPVVSELVPTFHRPSTTAALNTTPDGLAALVDRRHDDDTADDSDLR